jgi:hypothetical protein
VPIEGRRDRPQHVDRIVVLHSAPPDRWREPRRPMTATEA